MSNPECYGQQIKKAKCYHCKVLEQCYGVKRSKSKYNNEKTEVDGILFDSRKEANRYCELKILKAAGIIKDFKMQVPFVLQEGFRKGKRWHQAIKYIADFVVEYPDEHKEIEDCKGFRNQVYINKMKMFEAKYPDLTIREL